MLTIYSLKCTTDFVNKIFSCFSTVRILANSKESGFKEHLLERAIYLCFKEVL